MVAFSTLAPCWPGFLPGTLRNDACAAGYRRDCANDIPEQSHGLFLIEKIRRAITVEYSDGLLCQISCRRWARIALGDKPTYAFAAPE